MPRVVPGEQAAGYSFLPSSPTRVAQQISIEAAQPKLDLGVLKDGRQEVMLGVLDLDDLKSRRRSGRGAHPRGPRVRGAGPAVPAPDCGMKYLPRDVAFGKLKAMARAPKLCGGS